MLLSSSFDVQLRVGDTNCRLCSAKLPRPVVNHLPEFRSAMHSLHVCPLRVLGIVLTSTLGRGNFASCRCGSRVSASGTIPGRRILSVLQNNDSSVRNGDQDFMTHSLCDASIIFRRQEGVKLGEKAARDTRRDISLLALDENALPLIYFSTASNVAKRKVHGSARIYGPQ